jgi:hypothetical protein
VVEPANQYLKRWWAKLSLPQASKNHVFSQNKFKIQQAPKHQNTKQRTTNNITNNHEEIAQSIQHTLTFATLAFIHSENDSTPRAISFSFEKPTSRVTDRDTGRRLKLDKMSK